MPAYLISDVEVLDPAAFEEYRQKTPATVAAYGGRYLARGGALEVLEGDWTPPRISILEFPDLAAIRRWWSSPEYAPLRALRQRTARSNLVITEGIPGAIVP